MTERPWRTAPRTHFGDVLERHGSDKSTNHCYDPVYEAMFPDPLAVRNVLEIGVGHGGSLLAWRELFPNARIAGLDVTASEKCPRLDRMSIHMGSQDDKDKLREITDAAGEQFDLVIDDASHRIEHQLLSLFWLWPHVLPGGYYVVEEFDIYSKGGEGSVDTSRSARGAWLTGNRACLEVFGGVTLYDCPGPAGPEMLVVIRKGTP